MIIPSSAYKKYEKEVIKVLGYEGETIGCPVNIECKFYMGTHRKCDLTNLLEAIDDILVKAGVIEDDNYNIIVGHDFSRVYYDKENPRTEVIIKEV